MAWESQKIEWILLLILTFIIFVFVNPKLLFLTAILVTLFLLTIWLINNNLNLPEHLSGKFQVKQIIGNGIVIEKNLSNIFVKTNLNLAIDDWVDLDLSQIKKLDLSLNDQPFFNYLKSQRVFFIANKVQIKLIQTTPSLKQNVLNYFLDGPKFYSQYLPLTLLGYKIDWNQEIYQKLQSVSLIHLFVISGFHINLWIFILVKIANAFKIQNKYFYLIIPLILLPYLWLIGFPISAMRAYLLSYLLIFNKYCWNNKYDQINLLAITMLTTFLINPYIIISMSFLLSFLITYSILLVLRSANPKWIKLKIHFVAWMTSAILIAYLNENLNFSGLINGLILGPIVILIYFISALMFFIKPLMDNIFYLFDTIVNFFQLLVISINVKINLAIPIATYLILFSFLIYLNLKISFKNKTN